MHFNGWLCGAVLAIKGPDTNLHFTFCRAANSRLVRKMQNVRLVFGSEMLFSGCENRMGRFPAAPKIPPDVEKNGFLRLRFLRD